MIGYMGGGTHARDLALVAPALLRLLGRYPALRLRFWGSKPPDELGTHPRAEWVPLDLLNYAEFARFFSGQACDLALAPLEDTPFNRAKSAGKFLEYSALGIPGVYSDLPPYQGVVRPGENGCLAGSTAEWEARLSELIEDPARRCRMGAAAQETVRRDWLLSNHVGEWQAAIDRAAALAERRSPEDERRFERLAEILTQSAQSHLGLIRERDEQIRAGQRLSQALAAEQGRANLLEGQLNAILNSRSWQALQRLQKLRLGLIPEGSGGERLLKRLLKGLHLLR